MVLLSDLTDTIKGYRRYSYHWALRHTVCRIIQTKSYQRSPEKLREQYESLLEISDANYMNEAIEPCPIKYFDRAKLESLIVHCKDIESLSTKEEIMSYFAATRFRNRRNDTDGLVPKYDELTRYDLAFEMMWAAYLAAEKGAREPDHSGGYAGFPSQCQMHFFAAAICRHVFGVREFANLVMETYYTFPVRDFWWGGAPDITKSEQEELLEEGVWRSMKLYTDDNTNHSESLDEESSADENEDVEIEEDDDSFDSETEDEDEVEKASQNWKRGALNTSNAAGGDSERRLRGTTAHPTHIDEEAKEEINGDMAHFGYTHDKNTDVEEEEGLSQAETVCYPYSDIESDNDIHRHGQMVRDIAEKLE